MAELRVGVHVHPQHAGYAEMRAAWVTAEALGVDSVFTWDHFFPLYGDPDGKHFEGLALLAAMAEATERVGIGSLVFSNSYRNAQYLADAMRTIDHVSGGRAIVGIGGGWFQRDYQELGYEYGSFGTRLDALARDLPLLKERLRRGNPPPLGPMPVLVGGAGERKTLRIVAEHADVWNSEGDLETYRHKAAVLRAHCAAVGRDPDTIEHSWNIEPGEVERADALHAAGVDHIIVKAVNDGGGYDTGPVRELVQWRDEQRRRAA
jgi:probable F420-dependent oxidoreductase